MDKGSFLPKKNWGLTGCLQGIICGVSLAFLSSCSDGGVYSELEHNYGEISRDFPAYSWYNIENATEEELYKKFLSVGSGQYFNFMPDDSEVSKRINYWVDLIDKTLRNKYPSQLSNIPTPKVWVSDSKVENAFVSMMPMCYPVPVIKDFDKFNKYKSMIPEDQQIATLFAYIAKDNIGLFPVSQCLPAKNVNYETLTTVLADISRKHPTCQLQLVTEYNEFYIKVGECPDMDNPLINELGGTSSLAVVTIPNRIMFLGGMLEFLGNESYVVSVLAHEMAHYYRAHAEVLSDELTSSQYDYAYEVGEVNPSSKPQPSQDVQVLDLGAKLRNLSFAKYEISRIEGQRFRSELFDIMLALSMDIYGQQKCEDDQPGCNTSCKDLTGWLKNPSHHVVWSSRFPAPIHMTEDYKKQYFELEDKLQSCFSGVRIGDDPQNLTNGTNVKLEDFKSRIELLSKFAGKEGLLDGVEFSGNVLDEIQKAELKLLEEYSIKDQLLEEGFQKNIGVYSKEQEADEMSVEILHEIGVDLKTAVHLYLTLATKAQERFELYGIDDYPHSEKLVSCLALHENGWKTPDGKPYFVNVGNYTDTHHSSCFRAYNLDREIKAHPEYNTVLETKREQMLSDEEFEKYIKDIEDYRSTHRQPSIIYIVI